MVVWVVTGRWMGGWVAGLISWFGSRKNTLRHTESSLCIGQKFRTISGNIFHFKRGYFGLKNNVDS